MSGSTDILPAGGAPIDSELMQMMRQSMGQQQEILLRLQAIEDARSPPPPPPAELLQQARQFQRRQPRRSSLYGRRTEVEDPPPAPQRATRQPRVRLAATPRAREPDPAEYRDGNGEGGDGEG
jgi:hypothetical protein